jgi:hypothetical protein
MPAASRTGNSRLSLNDVVCRPSKPPNYSRIVATLLASALPRFTLHGDSIMRMTHAVSALALVILVTACKSDPSAPDVSSSLLNEDVVTVAADATAGDVEVMRGPGAGPFAFGFRADPAKFECTDDTKRGLTIKRSCIFKDAAGATQPAYDPVSTATAALHVEINGTVDRGFISMTVDRTRQFVASGLAGENATLIWNGTGQGSSTRVRTRDDSTTRTYELSHITTVTNVVVPQPRTATSWPLSGSVTKVVNGTVTGPKGTKEFTRTVVITFNGTNTPVATLDGERFDIDLNMTRRAKRASR